MADHFDQVSSSTQDELRGGTRLVPIRVIAATTKPSGIYFETRLDLTLIDPTQIAPIVDVTAQALEGLAANQYVGGVIYFQDVNRAGQLLDMVAVTVLSTSGNSDETHDYPLMHVVALWEGTSTSTSEPSIADIVARLDAIEAM